MKLKKGLYMFVLAVFLLTACGKAKTDAKKEQVKSEQDEKKEQSEETNDTEESSENTSDNTEPTEDLQESDGESSETTEDKVNNTQTEVPTAPTETSKNSTEKPSSDKTNQGTSKDDTTSPGTTTEKPSTDNNSSSDSTNTQKPSSDSDNTGNSSQSPTDSQLKQEADSNASKYLSYYQEVLRLVNEIRAEVGVAPLTLDTTLCKAASMRALEMDYNNIMSHTRPDGSDWWTVLEFYEASYVTCGENVAAGYTSPASVVEGWKNSPGHYQNMISEDFTKLGVGYSAAGVGDYGRYWCQLFSN